MKIARYKKAQRTLTFYKNNFQFREPFQLLIDATFCQVALQVSTQFVNRLLFSSNVFYDFFNFIIQYQINIQDQLPKYLQAPLKLVTTQCIIMEAEQLGAQLTGATQIVKQFLVHRCGHDKAPINGSACIKSMVNINNHYLNRHTK